jgi:hypothetical protein
LYFHFFFAEMGQWKASWSTSTALIFFVVVADLPALRRLIIGTLSMNNPSSGRMVVDRVTRLEEVVRSRLEACDDDAGGVDMLEGAHQALFNDTRDQEAMEEEAKLFYKMMDSTKIPLHDNTTVSQLDAIGRLLGVKSELNISRAGINRLLVVVGVDGVFWYTKHVHYTLVWICLWN